MLDKPYMGSTGNYYGPRLVSSSQALGLDQLHLRTLPASPSALLHPIKEPTSTTPPSISVSRAASGMKSPPAGLVCGWVPANQDPVLRPNSFIDGSPRSAFGDVGTVAGRVIMRFIPGWGRAAKT